MPALVELNEFRLHEAAVYFEGEVQFDDILWPRKGSAATYLNFAQPVSDRVGVTEECFSCIAYARIMVLPHPKRFK